MGWPKGVLAEPGGLQKLLYLELAGEEVGDDVVGSEY
jgi:hypothetical protein